MQYKFSVFFKLVRKIFFVYLTILSMFMIFRLLLLFLYGDFSELKESKIEILKAFYVGAKFDTSVATYGILPIFVYALFFSIFYFKKNQKAFQFFLKISKWYFIIISMLFLVISIIDYFFYGYFQTHISPLIYGLKNDKTNAILISMWTDYPVIKIVLTLLLAFYIFKLIYTKIFSKLTHKLISFKKFNPIVVVLILGTYFLGMRGSIGMFPLRLDHTSISTNTFVNELVLNGPFALKLANGLKSETSLIHIDSAKTLKNYNFKSKHEALNLYLNKNISRTTTLSKALTTVTKKNKFLEENPPNVVFVLMESLSKHYLDLHSENFNILGELNNELPFCYTFKNFLSAKNLTVETLESILLGTPKAPISQSQYYNYHFKSSVANPFKNAGYETTYLTGGQLGWRNTGRLIENQNFDKIQGFSFLEKKFKNPEHFTWGVHDEYLYKHIFDVLTKTNMPQFIFTLTVSNHTPYSLPKHFVKPNLKIPSKLKTRLISKENIALKNFISFYYSANEFGKFVNKIRNSPLGDNTIIVATGDHNERGMFSYKTDELFLKRSVPLIMYIPKKYQPSFVNLKRFASHKDIFPTVFNLALSKKDYIKTGNDLFSEKETDFFAINDYITASDKNGVVILENNKKPLFYKWKDTLNYKGLKPVDLKKYPELQLLKRKMQAQGAVMMLNFQDEIILKNKSTK